MIDYDPQAETLPVMLDAWEMAKLRTLLESPAAAVHGTSNNLRMISLAGKLDSGIKTFMDKGAYKPNNQVMQKATEGPAKSRKKRG